MTKMLLTCIEKNMEMESSWLKVESKNISNEASVEAQLKAVTIGFPNSLEFLFNLNVWV